MSARRRRRRQEVLLVAVERRWRGGERALSPDTVVADKERSKNHITHESVQKLLLRLLRGGGGMRPKSLYLHVDYNI